jgi:hypothetical protein
MARVVFNNPKLVELSEQAAKDRREGCNFLMECDFCGRGFYAKRKAAKYCSDTCRAKASRPLPSHERVVDGRKRAVSAKRGQSITRECVECGEPFTVSGLAVRSAYCSNKCKMRAYRARRLAKAQNFNYQNKGGNE